MIECKNLSIGYGKKVVAADICFTAKSGEISVIIGKNGCGKSTLLKSIAGIIPSSGIILIDGKCAANLGISCLSKSVSMMPQMLVSPPVTVRELVSYGRQPYTGLYGNLSVQDKIIVENTISELKIKHIANSRLDHISGGERQKAYFAMLIAQNTPNLILDEPSAHLDNEYSLNLCSFLVSEKHKGKAVIAVLHDINRAMDIADKITVIDSGRIIFDDTPESFSMSDIPERVFRLTRYNGVSADGKNRCMFFK